VTISQNKDFQTGVPRPVGWSENTTDSMGGGVFTRTGFATMHHAMMQSPLFPGLPHSLFNTMEE